MKKHIHLWRELTVIWMKNSKWISIVRNSMAISRRWKERDVSRCGKMSVICVKLKLGLWLVGDESDKRESTCVGTCKTHPAFLLRSLEWKQVRCLTHVGVYFFFLTFAIARKRVEIFQERRWKSKYFRRSKLRFCWLIIIIISDGAMRSDNKFTMSAAVTLMAIAPLEFSWGQTWPITGQSA